jgi:hypothetical protein
MSSVEPPAAAEGSGSTVPPRKRLFVDTRPLQESPEYRRLWIGQSLSAIGSMITVVAVPVQIYDLTHSSFAGLRRRSR